MQASSRVFGAERDSEQAVDELLYVREGGGTLLTQGQSFALRAGDLLINPRGRLVGADGQITLTQILFNEELFSPSVHTEKEALYVLGVVKIYARQRNLISLSKIGAERLSSLLDAMLWEFRNRYRGYSWALRLKLIELLMTVMRDRSFRIPVRGLKPFSNSRIQDVVLYLYTDYMNPISVEEVMRTAALGRSQFHALFKAETGKTFTEYLADIRCDKAAELLVGSDRTILDIAMSCGFGNLSHFYHVFKRKKGTSPGRYRRAIG
jgi:AraC-like DNA-binding protein